MDAVAAVRDAVEALAPLARVRGVRVVVSADEVPVVRARRDGLLQVAQNLVDNALKHAPEGSDVDVRIARGERGEVRVSVRDHGPGIPADARPTLFERFRAPVDGPRSSTGGLGIGLHVVKSWVDAFGGCVEAGAPEGGGAQRCVRLRAWEGTG